MAVRRRGWTGVIVGLVVILILLWVGYWFAARYAAGEALARLEANGIAACADPSLGGFPLALEVRCSRVTHDGGSESLNAELGSLEATALLYKPGTVDADIAAPLVVNAPSSGVALTASWSLATARASAWLRGLTGFGASFVGLTADNASTVPGLPLDGLTAASVAAEVSPSGRGSYAVMADARELTITRSDGSALPQLDGEARLTLEGVGNSLGTDPAETLFAWLRNKPSARIEKIKISGEGAIVTSEGKLNLTDDGRLNGSILFRWNDIARLADLIEAIFPGTRERAETPLQGLNAVSVAAETEDGPMRQTTLTFTNGMIWLGIFPLPIDPIPPLRF